MNARGAVAGCGHGSWLRDSGSAVVRHTRGRALARRSDTAQARGRAPRRRGFDRAAERSAVKTFVEPLSASGRRRSAAAPGRRQPRRDHRAGDHRPAQQRHDKRDEDRGAAHALLGLAGERMALGSRCGERSASIAELSSSTTITNSIDTTRISRSRGRDRQQQGLPAAAAARPAPPAGTPPRGASRAGTRRSSSAARRPGGPGRSDAAEFVLGGHRGVPSACIFGVRLGAAGQPSRSPTRRIRHLLQVQRAGLQRLAARACRRRSRGRRPRHRRHAAERAGHERLVRRVRPGPA